MCRTAWWILYLPLVALGEIIVLLLFLTLLSVIGMDRIATFFGRIGNLLSRFRLTR
jgi:hypothetical protein